MTTKKETTAKAKAPDKEKAKPEPRHDVRARLAGTNGNAYQIVRRTLRALRRKGASRNEQAEFIKEALPVDPDKLMLVVNRWVRTE